MTSRKRVQAFPSVSNSVHQTGTQGQQCLGAGNKTHVTAGHQGWILKQAQLLPRGKKGKLGVSCFRDFYKNFTCACVCVCLGMHHRAHVKVRGQPVAISSLLARCVTEVELGS